MVWFVYVQGYIRKGKHAAKNRVGYHFLLTYSKCFGAVFPGKNRRNPRTHTEILLPVGTNFKISTVLCRGSPPRENDDTLKERDTIKAFFASAMHLWAREVVPDKSTNISSVGRLGD